jgi:multicomponent Na+:H+ antiporter subunit E
MIRRVRAWAVLLGVFAVEMAKSVMAVSAWVLRREQGFRPAIIAIPLDARTDAEISLFADMITLTPGTTSLHVSEDRKILYVHAMDAPDPEAAAAEMKRTFETRVLEACR